MSRKKYGSVGRFDGGTKRTNSTTKIAENTPGQP
jgi:hypothetical protein